MILIADSSSITTHWAVISENGCEFKANTSGINPFFQSRREISHIIRLELPDQFFHKRWKHVFFYGPGCVGEDKVKTVEASLVAQFRTQSTVENNLLGAARALLGKTSGIACILSTGANTCYYNGHEIVKNVTPGGYLLGDEGSNAYLGKILLSDIVKNLAPKHIISKFYEKYQTNSEHIISDIYSKPQINLVLAKYAEFIHENLDSEYCQKIAYDAFITFMNRNISQYDYMQNPISIVGSTFAMFEGLFRQAAQDFGATIGKTIRTSLEGLIEYHKANL